MAAAGFTAIAASAMIHLGENEIGAVVVELLRLEIGGWFRGGDFWEIGGRIHPPIIGDCDIDRNQRLRVNERQELDRCG